MSALGEYYRAMGSAAMTTAAAQQGHIDVGHEQAAAAQTGANAAMRNAQSQAVLHAAQAFLTNQQGKVVVPMSNAQMGYINAQTTHLGAQTQQLPYDSQSHRDLEAGQRDYYEQGAREKWGDVLRGQTVDENGNPTGNSLPQAPDSLSPRSPLIGAPSGGMPPPPPTIGQTHSAAPMPSIGDAPSVSPSQAIGYPSLPGAGVQSPFKGRGDYNYSAPPKYAKGTSCVGGMPHYADGVSSVGPALMNAPLPSFDPAPSEQSQPLPSAPSDAGALIGTPAPMALAGPDPHDFVAEGRLPAGQAGQADGVSSQYTPGGTQVITRRNTGPIGVQGTAGGGSGGVGPSGVATNYNGIPDSRHPGVSSDEMSTNYRLMGMSPARAAAASAGAPSRREQSYSGFRTMGYNDRDAQYFTSLQYGLPGHKPFPNGGMPYESGTEFVNGRYRDYEDYSPVHRDRRGYSDGTSDINAPGDGTVDTVNAKLANGEAVLNRGAAEHLGQPAIRALNAIGAARMGMVPGAGARNPQVEQANAAQTAGKTVHYAKGTSKAAPKGKAAPDKGDSKPDAKDAKGTSKPAGKPAASKGSAPSDTPSLDQIDPKMLAAVMQMGALGQQGAQPDPQQQPQPQPGQTPMGMM